jgi:hypothetical protein
MPFFFTYNFTLFPTMKMGFTAMLTLNKGMRHEIRI